MNENIEKAVAEFRAFVESDTERNRATRGPGMRLTFEQTSKFFEIAWGKPIDHLRHVPGIGWFVNDVHVQRDDGCIKPPSKQGGWYACNCERCKEEKTAEMVVA